jgi:hypothetical protein
MVSIAPSPSLNMQANIPSHRPRPTFYLNPFMRIPLLMPDDPRAFAISMVSLEDMNLTLQVFCRLSIVTCSLAVVSRIVYLRHRYHVGGYLPRVKCDALLRGDTSNAVIHPFFIYFAHALGSRLYQESTGVPSFLLVTVVSMQLAWEALASTREEDDPFTMAQIYQVLSTGFIHCGRLRAAGPLIERAVGILKRNNIRFVPISSSDAAQVGANISAGTSQCSEEVRERAACLARLMQSEYHLHLVAGETEVVCSDLETQFRYELPVRILEPSARLG